MPSFIEAIATGNPPHTGTQDEAAAFMQRVTSLPERIRSRIPALYQASGIGQRYTAVEDYVREADDFSFFAPDWSLAPAPTTAQRNAHYRATVVPLAEGVARRALDAAGRDAASITHVVTATCTGFFAPGLDIELVKRLGLPPTTQRAAIGFMGCYAAFNALRVADSFVRANPGAVVLVVCAELCTLHFQVNDSIEQAVVNALFADGAAAAIVSGESRPGRLAYVDNHVLLDDDSMDDMTWDIGDTGFSMTLASSVPRVIAGHLPRYLDTLLGRNGLDVAGVDWWAIHPGGRAIVEKAQEVLGLPDAAVADSFAVLRDYGNMSSATILFVLKRFLQKHQAAVEKGERGLGAGVAMAFGPGLTLEGALLRGV